MIPSVTFRGACFLCSCVLIVILNKDMFSTVLSSACREINHNMPAVGSRRQPPEFVLILHPNFLMLIPNKHLTELMIIKQQLCLMNA